MAPQGHPRTPNGSEMTSQIAPKSILGSSRAPSAAPQGADVAPRHQKSRKIHKHNGHSIILYHSIRSYCQMGIPSFYITASDHITRWAFHHFISQHQIILPDGHSIILYHSIRSISDEQSIFFVAVSGWHWETCTQIRCPKTIKMDLNGVQVGPFGLKLYQNDAPDLRIFFQTLLSSKT